MENKAWGYCRVSTDKQDVSLEVQQDKIKHYCLAHDLFLEKTIVEKNVSGKIALFERPEGSLIRDSKVQNIVILKLDRAFRSTTDALLTMKYFDDKKINVHIIDMGGTSLNTKSAVGELMLTMLSAFAQLERRQIGERTKAGLRKRAENGMTYSRNAPFGFSSKGKGTPLISVAAEQSIIDMIRDTVALRQKISLRKMAKVLPDNPRTGKPMYPKLILKIKNEVLKKYAAA